MTVFTRCTVTVNLTLLCFVFLGQRQNLSRSVANIPKIMTELAFGAGSVCIARFGGFRCRLYHRACWFDFKTNTKMIVAVEIRATFARFLAFSGIPGVSSDGRHSWPRVTRVETFVTLFVDFTVLGRAAIPRRPLCWWRILRSCLGRQTYFPEVVAIFFHLTVGILRTFLSRCHCRRDRCQFSGLETESMKGMAVFIGSAVCIWVTALACFVWYSLRIIWRWTWFPIGAWLLKYMKIEK